LMEQPASVTTATHVAIALLKNDGFIALVP
jgi:hypothetical protein